MTLKKRLKQWLLKRVFIHFCNFTTLAQCLKITQNVTFEFWHFPPIFVLLNARLYAGDITAVAALYDGDATE